METTSNKKSLINMIDSCFTYGSAERGSYNYTRYIEPYKKLLPKTFDRIFDDRLLYLQNNATITHGVYTGTEGETYNSLTFKNI